MKIAYISDIHHEFGNQVDVQLQERVDVLVLVGDIDAGKKVVDRAVFIANGNARHVVFICGNHEFYGSRIDKVHTRINLDLVEYYADTKTNADPELHFLNDTFVDIDGYRFAGNTCWTDFELTGDPYLSSFKAEGAMNDYRRIKFFDERRNIYRKLRANDVMRFNLYTKFFLFEEIAHAINEGRHDKLVIVTHHGPTHMSIDPDFIGNELNPAYANNWGRKIAYEGGPKLWFHGHIHCDKDYMCGDTRVLCNPYGYPGQRRGSRIKTVEI